MSITWENADGAIVVEADKHQADVIRGGCICGYAVWSAEHVAVMAFREVARHLRPQPPQLPPVPVRMPEPGDRA